MAMQADTYGYIDAGRQNVLFRNRILIGLIGLHLAVTLGAGMLATTPFNPGTFNALLRLFGLLLPVFAVTIVTWRFCVMAVRIRPERPIHWLAHDLWRLVGDRDRLMEGAFTLLALMLFTACFGYFKSIIPQLNPFSWDPALARLDMMLHGGTAPHEYLMRIFGAPRVMSLFNTAYHVWFFVMYFIVFLACFTSGADLRATRNTFLVAFVLTWGLGGNVLATAFASGGPVYFEKLGFGTDYAQLNAMLAAFDRVSPLSALDTQEMLWQGYVADGRVSGISAMPSMHVASSTLLALYGFRHAPWAGWLLTAFTAMIGVGAVLLAWHYALDVYAGALFALFCWWAAARLTGDDTTFLRVRSQSRSFSRAT